MPTHLPKRGMRRRGGRDTVKTNYSKKTLKAAGALGRDTLDSSPRMAVRRA